MADYHRQFLTLVDEIERTFPVADWRVGDVPVWPLARTVLYSNLCEDMLGEGGAEGHAARQRLGRSARIARAAAYAVTPLINIWRSRIGLRHVVLLPHRAHALFLGDGTSLDRVGGLWRDRFCDPLIDQLHARGASSLLMQRGDFPHVPSSRPAFAANTIIHWGQLFAGPLRMSPRLETSFADHDGVLRFLEQRGAPTLGLSAAALRERAAAVSVTASAFERLLGIVRPTLCFMVGYFWGMGHALALACRRRGILSVELQREGRSGRHEAYIWSAVPEEGYEILPAVFWTWTQGDADAIRAWTKTPKRPWHRSIHGGHPQIAAWLDGNDAAVRAADATINAIRTNAPAEREILVALQILGGHEDLWNALASLIEAGPSHWRWWIRRHPSTLQLGDQGLGRLPAVSRPNVLIDLPSSLPLPSVLRHMDALVTATSGAAVEASMFGLRSFFLSAVARDLHPHLLETGGAEIVTDMKTLEDRLRSVPRGAGTGVVQPNLSETLSQLTAIAEEYRELCKSA